MEKEKLIELVKKSQSANPDAIEKLLQYAHTSVSYQCRKMLNNEQDAEDMTQEVLVTIYTKLDTLQEPAAFWKWANQITATRCINALNRTHVEYQFTEDDEGHSILDTLEELDEQVIPDKAIDNAETARMIEEIIGGLPDAQRAVTLMFYYNEMSVKEIAQTMQVSENTVKSRLNYARKAIKEKVLDYEKQGVKLYGLSPLPFLLYFLRLAAKNSADKDAAGAMVAEVMSAEGAAAGIAGASAAGAGSAAVATGGSVATTAAATTATTGIFARISAKVVAGVLAAVVTIGSVAAVVIPNTQADTTEPGSVPTEATFATKTEYIPETELPTTEAPTEEVTEAPTEEITEATGEVVADFTIDTAEAPTEETTETPTEAPTEETTETPTEAPTEEPETENNETVHQHSYEYTVTSPPTCSNPGEATYTCKNCGHSYTESITAEHDYKLQYSTATCSYGGTAYYTCTCGASYEEEVPKNEHVWSDWVVTKEPTTTTYGKKWRTCELCNGGQEANIDPLPADETEPAVTETSSGDCPSCGIGNISLVLLTEPTCESRGEAAGQCDYCGYISGYSYPPANGHNMVDGVCTVCGAAETACNHVYDGGVENWPAGSMTWEPYILYTCTLCGHTYTELIDYLP